MLRSRADLEAAQARAGDRIAFETLLLQAYGEADEWYLPGFCQVCDTSRCSPIAGTRRRAG